MKVEQLMEFAVNLDAGYEIREIPKSFKQDIDRMIELLSSTTNSAIKRTSASQITQRLGGPGKLWGLYFEDELVGTIAVKPVKFDEVRAAELGFFYITPEHAIKKNIDGLVRTAMSIAKKFDLVYTMTSARNKPMTAAMNRSNYLSLIFSAHSPITNKLLNFWLANASNGTMSEDERIEALKQRFAQLHK